MPQLKTKSAANFLAINGIVQAWVGKKLLQNEYSALVRSPPSPLEQQSMMANSLREAPDSTMKLAPTAKCRTASTKSSAPAFLDSSWTLGLSPNRKQQSRITYYKNEPISLPEDLKDMATIFARLTLLLVGADACILHIINSVWVEDDDARLALEGPRGDLSLI